MNINPTDSGDDSGQDFHASAYFLFLSFTFPFGICQPVQSAYH